MNFFLCDIYGTFKNNKSSDIEREKSLKKFVKALENLIEIDGHKDLFFCFISTQDKNEINNYIDEFEKHIENEKIKSYIHFSEYHKHHNGIIEEINERTKMEQIKTLIEKHKINKIYFADDTKMYHTIMNKLIPLINSEIEIINFIPEHSSNKESLDDLTNKINIYIKQKSINNKNINKIY